MITGSGGDSSYYVCYITSGDAPAAVGSSVYMNVEEEDESIDEDEVTVLFPSNSEEAEITCFEFKKCKVPCIFGGR